MAIPEFIVDISFSEAILENLRYFEVKLDWIGVIGYGGNDSIRDEY